MLIKLKKNTTYFALKTVFLFFGKKIIVEIRGPCKKFYFKIKRILFNEKRII